MQSFIIFQGKKIVYHTAGAGDMVVLLHGFAEDSSIWENQVPILKQHHQIILPDLPGSGQSEFVENGSIEVFADAIQQIILTVQSNQPNTTNTGCAIIGHSMGGYITLAIAEKYPQLIHCFGLFHSSAYADTGEKIATRKKAIAFIEKNGVDPFLQNSIPGLFYQPDQSDFSKLLIEKGKSFTQKALIQYYEAMINRPDRTPILKQSTQPVLFISGEHDKAVPLESSLEQCHLPAQAYLHILQHSAHMGMLEEKTKSNAILLQFLNNCYKRG